MTEFDEATTMDADAMVLGEEVDRNRKYGTTTDSSQASSQLTTSLKSKSKRERNIDVTILDTDSINAIRYKCALHRRRARYVASTTGEILPYYPPSDIPLADLEQLLKSTCRNGRHRTIDTSSDGKDSHAEATYKRRIDQWRERENTRTKRIRRPAHQPQEVEEGENPPSADLTQIMQKTSRGRGKQRIVDTTVYDSDTRAERMHKKKIDRSRLQSMQKREARQNTREETRQLRDGGSSTVIAGEEISIDEDTGSIEEDEGGIWTFMEDLDLMADPQTAEGSSFAQKQGTQADNTILTDIDASCLINLLSRFNSQDIGEASRSDEWQAFNLGPVDGDEANIDPDLLRQAEG